MKLQNWNHISSNRSSSTMVTLN